MASVSLINVEHDVIYPNSTFSFSPSELYPEYPWMEQTIAKEKNEVYCMVRKCFQYAKLDAENYGKETWNPLGKWIKPGDVVLLKPNWVENKNKNKNVDDKLACLVTNPSVVRAIADYVVIALKGEGKIIIGDAPMQGCNLEEMFRITGYDKLFEFYSDKSVNIVCADLRKYCVENLHKGVLSKPIETKDSWGSIEVEIDSYSMHAEKDDMNLKYKVSDYKISDTYKYHHDSIHKYEINKMALNADVIINIPKPKTHRLAGITAACKNLVGVIYEKSCLPHRVEGDVAHGGDAYLKKSIWKEWMNVFDEKRTSLSIDGHYNVARVYDWMRKVCYVVGAMLSRDKYRIGSWYGNDTIWRTTIDLNFILRYADKLGNIKDEEQRKIVTIADMIVCGQGEGPVAPHPKQLNSIMMSDNNMLFDRVMCEIMGFSAKKISMFNDSKALNLLGYKNLKELEKERIVYNNLEMNVSNFHGKPQWKFEPHSCWKGHIDT